MAFVCLAGLVLAAALAAPACAPDPQLPAIEQLPVLKRDGRAQPRPCVGQPAELAGSPGIDEQYGVKALPLQGWVPAGQILARDQQQAVPEMLEPFEAEGCRRARRQWRPESLRVFQAFTTRFVQ
ncbi:MAG TPA: hypothetical protein VK876_01180 [Rubrivivax sp.]|nr:hypothetical protein [Rubrivivax sp.]